ncbi:MAG: AbrB family transcriptional regulator [Dehalobacterium sp.]
MFRFFETLVVALLGGALCSSISIPLPWMLGPVATIVVWSSILKRKVFWPVKIRNSGLIILGFMMGTSFNVFSIGQILYQLPSMISATGASLIFSIIIGYIMHRLAGISLTDSIIGGMPGGLSQMAVFCEEIPGADITVVTFMQTIRLLSTVFIVPFIVIHGLAGNPNSTFIPQTTAYVGYVHFYPYWLPLLLLSTVLFSAWVAVRIHLPTPYLMGPLLGTTFLVLTGVPNIKPPYFFSVLSQLCIGTYIGTNIKITNMKDWKKLFPFFFLGSITLIIFSFGIGIMLNHVYHLTLIDAFLCTAPGGMAEMCLTALVVNGNVSLVSVYQLFRVIFILLVMPPLLKRGILLFSIDSDSKYALYPKDQRHEEL